MARSDFITIANGQTSSNEIKLGSRSPMAILIISPASLPETVNIQVSGRSQSGLLKSGTDRIALTAGDAQMVMIFHAEAILLKATGAVAGARVFEILWSLTGEIG